MPEGRCLRQALAEPRLPHPFNGGLHRAGTPFPALSSLSVDGLGLSDYSFSAEHSRSLDARRTARAGLPRPRIPDEPALAGCLRRASSAGPGPGVCGEGAETRSPFLPAPRRAEGAAPSLRLGPADSAAGLRDPGGAPAPAPARGLPPAPQGPVFWRAAVTSGSCHPPPPPPRPLQLRVLNSAPPPPPRPRALPAPGRAVNRPAAPRPAPPRSP